ncbi:MAG: ABC transporter ATP-binding protein [bacterium]
MDKNKEKQSQEVLQKIQTELQRQIPISLEIKELKVYFLIDKKEVKAVDGVNLCLYKGKTLGLVGESGCGKSLTALSILRLTPPQSQIVGGKILFEGEDLLKYSNSQLRQIRGGKISMIFQDASSSLNPVFTIGNQIYEAIRLHQNLSPKEAKEKVKSLLKLVGIPSPEEQFFRYPHQLSGGMNQRVMIAMAVASNPAILIADEPTTALDVTIQAQVLVLLKELQAKLNMSILLITHDLSIIAQITDYVAIMYAGKIVEEATTNEIFSNPLHPYTKALLASIPKLDSETKRLPYIPGTVPNGFFTSLTGCRFHPRCKEVTSICTQEEPVMKKIDNTHQLSCWKI